MHLLTTTDPVAVAHEIIKARMKHRFFVTVAPIPGSTTRILYGSLTSCHDALIEAVTDHPLAVKVGELEYLDPTALKVLHAIDQSDPISAAFKALGKIDNPDPDNLKG
jgi:hypothetical protein